MSIERLGGEQQVSEVKLPDRISEEFNRFCNCGKTAPLLGLILVFCRTHGEKITGHQEFNSQLSAGLQETPLLAFEFCLWVAKQHNLSLTEHFFEVVSEAKKLLERG